MSAIYLQMVWKKTSIETDDDEGNATTWSGEGNLVEGLGGGSLIFLKLL